MSRNIKSLLVFAVLASIAVGASNANAAQITPAAQRRQHPGVGFYTHAHGQQSHAITRTSAAYNAPVFRQTVVRTPTFYSAPTNASQVVPTHHFSHRFPSAVKPVTYRNWESRHTHS